MTRFNHTPFLLLLALCISMLVWPDASCAGPPANLLTDGCTQSQYFDFDQNPVNQAQDLLQTVIDEITTAVSTASENLYQAFVGSANYGKIINAAFTLVVLFFAVSFMFGFVTLTLAQGVIRLIKIGIIAWIASPTGYNTFVEPYFIQFFNEGSAWLINAMINLAETGAVGTPSTSVSAPFGSLDAIIRVVFSPRMFVTIIGTASTGPFGFMVAGALIWSVFSIFMTLLKALQIYALAIVIKAVLLGMTPVFLPMMLFDRTKQMFMGWVNQLVNFSLQPILLFAFVAFFATLVESAARDILPADDVHLCYVKADNQAATPFEVHGWRYQCCPDGGGACEVFEGDWTWTGGIECNNNKIFPMNHVNVLVFLLLTHIMLQLTSVAVAIAAEISQGVMKLDQIPNAINEWFGGAGGAGGGISSNWNRVASRK